MLVKELCCKSVSGDIYTQSKLPMESNTKMYEPLCCFKSKKEKNKIRSSESIM